MRTLTALQIGRCGELLVQHRRLKLGIESAALTADTGIDLVAYALGADRPAAIRVKAKLAPLPAGGKGPPALEWWVSKVCPADMVAFVDLSEERVWMLRMSDVADLAQQRSGGRLHF